MVIVVVVVADADADADAMLMMTVIHARIVVSFFYKNERCYYANIPV